MNPARRTVWGATLPAWAGVLVLLSGCSTSVTDRGMPAQGTRLETTNLHYGLSARTYLLHVPPNYDAQKAWPLIIVLHGAFSTASGFENKSGFSAFADREGIIVAYPNGIGVLGRLQHWNAGHCCGLAEKDHVDDVGFLRYVIDDVARKVRIDPQRIYMAGHSNGAMLAYQFASENSQRVAAICVVSGSIGSAQGKGHATRMTGPPPTAVPLLAIHGRQDKTVPFAGGLGLHSGGRYFVPVPDSVALWARYCGCNLMPEARADPDAGLSTLTWCDAKGATWAVLYTLEDWDHTWPGPFSLQRLPPDHPLRPFDTLALVWDFFCRHPLPQSPAE